MRNVVLTLKTHAVGDPGEPHRTMSDDPIANTNSDVPIAFKQHIQPQDYVDDIDITPRTVEDMKRSYHNISTVAEEMGLIVNAREDEVHEIEQG